MTPLSHADYIRKINRDLPREAFAPAPKKLLRMFAYLASTVLAYLGFRVTSSVLWCAALSLFIGHTLACIGFLAHELAHGAIVRAPRTRHALELFFWALVLVPATVWKRVHNHTHHVHSNTPRDSDRPLRVSRHSGRPGRCGEAAPPPNAGASSRAPAGGGRAHGRDRSGPRRRNPASLRGPGHEFGVRRHELQRHLRFGREVF